VSRTGKSRKSTGMLFGTAGVPHSSGGSDPASGVSRVAELGLQAMELEFVHGVRIRDEMADRVRRAAEEHGIVLTCHGPYYINLNSQEKEKRQASIKRILDTARAAHRVGARSITFHAAFYMKQDPQKVHRVVREALAGIMNTLEKEKIRVQVRPELTGKPSQYGDLQELLALSTEVEGVFPCIDFSHFHARTGAQNSLGEFEETLKTYARVLGGQALSDLHLHVSGIEFTGKGERRHLNLKEAGFKYRDLLKALESQGAGGVLICESPNLEEDALLLQQYYGSIRGLKPKHPR
jgi:deoxyribonuclease-4